MSSQIHMVELLAFGASLLGSGFFSGSEAALMSISVNRTKQLIEQGGARGKALRFLSERPNEMLTTILVGNNIVNIFAASLTTTIANRYFANDAIAVSVGITTLLILIFGEIIPKTFARGHAERLAVPIIRILQVNYFLLYPVVKLFMMVIRMVLGENARLTGRVVTKNDIEFMVNRAEKEKSIDSKHLDLLSSILEFPSIKVKDIMVPRNRVYGLKIGDTFERVIDLVREVQHSRYPVHKEGHDLPIGFVHVKDLAFIDDREKTNFELEKYITEPFFVYEHMKIQSVFDHMNRKKVHLAFVRDETGLMVGILTLEDIMEEIFGEIHDEHDDEDDELPSAGQDIKDGVTVPGDFSLRDLGSEYDIKIPLSDNYSTVTGLLLELLGNNFPAKGNVIYWNGLSFEISKVSNAMIQEVVIRDSGVEESVENRPRSNNREHVSSGLTKSFAK